MLANRQTLEFLLQNPEAFTQVGIADGTVLEQLVDEWIARVSGTT